MEEIDLYKHNINYLEEQINDKNIINEIKRKYYDNTKKDNNVYCFINSYIEGVKMIHQKYLETDYTLYKSILNNNSFVKIIFNCLFKTK